MKKKPSAPKKKNVSFTPAGYHSVTPYLACGDAAAAIEFYKRDQFYGDRTGALEDPFGHVWHLATHREDVSMAELRKRAGKLVKEMGG